VKAQTRSDFQFGIKGGLNYSNVYDEQGPDFNSNSKFGIVAGAFIGIPIGKYFGVHPEVLFSQKGFKINNNDPGDEYDFKRTSNCLDVPILLAIKPIEYFTILGGPQYSYLLSQYDVFKSNTTTTTQAQEFKNNDIRKNILGLMIGLDINLSSYVFSGRYAFDVQNNNGDGTSTTIGYKNSWVQATVGYRF
jgi:hypothetical protein